MDVKPESWIQRSMPPMQARRDSTFDIAWRRSGDGSAWNRPPRAARPHSCLEGRQKDQWIKTFNDLQINDLPQYHQRDNMSPSERPNVVLSSQSSLKSPYSELGSKERVQIKTRPSTQKAKVCCLAPVQIGWLPLQRHVVRTEWLNNGAQQDWTACKVKLKPPITPVLRCSSVKAVGSEREERTAGPGLRGLSGAFAVQADVKRKATLAERDQGTALEEATSVQNTACDGTPVHRRGSFPQVSLLTPPNTGGRTSPKPSSSISSITVASKRVIRSSSLPDSSLFGRNRDKESGSMDPDYMTTSSYKKVIPQRKALVVKITEQREATSRCLQPDAENCPDDTFSSSRSTGEHRFLPFSSSSKLTATNLPDAKNQPVLASLNVTGRDNRIPESHSQVPSFLPTQNPQRPVVLRRKASINKVQGERDTVSRDERNHRRMKLAYRHSISGLDITDVKPQSDNECLLSHRDMRGLNGNTKLFKSTLFFQVTSANGDHVDYPHTSRGFQSQRPASCYASLFSHVEPNADRSRDASAHRTVLPRETNIDPEYSAARSLNRCCSTEPGAGSHDKIYPRTDKGQSERESSLVRIQPLTLIKVPDRSTHETYDAIVARNAAAIIASIKLQREQKKITQSSGTTNSYPGL